MNTIDNADGLYRSELPLTKMMTTDFRCLHVNDSLRTALIIIKEKKIDTIPVIDEHGHLIGVLPRGKLIDALLQNANLDGKCTPYIVKNPRVYPVDFSYTELSFLDKIGKSKESTIPVVDESGQVLGLLGRLEYLRASVRLAESNMSQLVSIFQSMHEGIITVNRDGIIKLVNSSAEGMFGIISSEILGKHLNHHFPGLDFSNKLRLGMRNNLMGVPVIVNQVPIIRSNSFIGVMFVFLDLSYQESVVEELGIYKDLEDTLSGVLAASSDGVIVSDRYGMVKYANDSAAQLFSLTPSSMKGIKVSEYLGHEIPEHVVERGKTEVETLALGDRQCIVAHIAILDQARESKQPIGIVSKIYLDDNKLTREIARKWFTLQQQVNYYRQELENTNQTNQFNTIISKNNTFKSLIKEAKVVSRSNSTVLITGESGVGKDMFARAIHASSPRARHPFIKVNCAAIPVNLFESELFGYAPGSFTGALKEGKKGYFKIANKGSIFLDEIGDMPPAIQVKILQVLQDKEYTRVGGSATEKVDVRVIAATNVDLREAMKKGEFREDLYYRLNVIEFHLPPLRDRTEDILPLAEAFIKKYNSILGTKVVGISPEAEQLMQQYSWPGNVRELENAIERAANYAWEGEIQAEHLPPQITSQSDQSEVASKAGSIKDYESAIHEVNKRMILDALKTTQGNKSAAARMLNMSRTAFYEKMAKYVLNSRTP